MHIFNVHNWNICSLFCEPGIYQTRGVSLEVKIQAAILLDYNKCWHKQAVLSLLLRR